MPIYEYRCASCGHQQEFLQKVSDAPLTTCTQCGKPSLSKLLSAPGFHLKGSGWYATDFKNSGSKPAAKPAQSGETKSGEAKSGEAKSGDAKSGDAKSGDAKSGDATSGGEAKGGSETKTGEKKAAPSSGAGGGSAV
jgi:putative FmdB family regulatory protein